MPAAHALHCVRPVLFWKRPTGQMMHLVAALLSSSYCPTAHAMQPELPNAPAVEYVPRLHATHSLEALLS